MLHNTSKCSWLKQPFFIMCVDLQVRWVVLLILAGLTHVSTVIWQVCCVGRGLWASLGWLGWCNIPSQQARPDIFPSGSRVPREDSWTCKQVSTLFESTLLLLLPNAESVWEDTEEGHDARRPQCSQQQVQSQTSLHKAPGNWVLACHGHDLIRQQCQIKGHNVGI